MWCGAVCCVVLRCVVLRESLICISDTTWVRLGVRAFGQADVHVGRSIRATGLASGREGGLAGGWVGGHAVGWPRPARRSRTPVIAFFKKTSMARIGCDAVALEHPFQRAGVQHALWWQDWARPLITTY